MDTPRKILVQGLFVLALIAGLMGPAAFSTQAMRYNLHPSLLQMARATPQQVVAVIVQKADATQAAEQQALSLGASITRELHLINAFAAHMTAQAAGQLSTSPAVRWVSLDATVSASAVTTDMFTTWASSPGTSVANSFANSGAVVDSPLGPNGIYGSGSNVSGAFGGFMAEVSPANAISKVEVALAGYAAVQVRDLDIVKLKVVVNGVAGSEVSINGRAFDAVIGPAKAGIIYVDITASRAWLWADFDQNMELVINQSAFSSSNRVYYDAVGLRVTSATGVDTSLTAVTTIVKNPAMMDSMTTGAATDGAATDGAVVQTPAPINASVLANAYNAAVRAPAVWNEAPAYLRGQGMTIAVVDSGTLRHKDINGRLVRSANFNAAYHSAADKYGHGTFISDLIAGDGTDSLGQYIGIAPKANLINVRVSDDLGMATESDVVAGMQWVFDNKSRYNIQVVNLSFNSSVAQSYQTSPLDAAAELLWFNGIVVVVSAGNNGTAALYPPANDPFVITVGATDDNHTASLADDTLATFSAYGVAENGAVKPDLVAPGRNLVAYLADNNKLTVGKNHPANIVGVNYFRMSGTSMAAPIVSAGAALLLQSNPNLNPDQVKYRLMATANKSWPGYTTAKAGAGVLDIYAAIHGSSTQTANTGIPASRLLWTGNTPLTWASVGWNSVGWNSVAWNSVAWNSVAWNSVAWNSDYWGP